jgi:ABC-type sugar transport system permease subunit
MVLPVVAMEVLFVAVPLAAGVYYSLHRVDLLRLGPFIGLENYWRVIASPAVRNSLFVTLIFTFFALFFTFLAGLGLALLLERDTRLHIFGRAVVLVPYTVSMLVGSMLLKWVFSRDAGLIDLVLAPLGFRDVSILADPTNAMAALVFNAVWRDSAFSMILLMAGLKSVPLELYAASRVDGARSRYRFRRITLPLLRIPILITLIRLLVHFVNVLTFALVLTGGGPNDATNTLGLELYHIGFRDFRFGQANALAFLVFLFNVIPILIVVHAFREKRRRP